MKLYSVPFSSSISLDTSSLIVLFFSVTSGLEWWLRHGKSYRNAWNVLAHDFYLLPIYFKLTFNYGILGGYYNLKIYKVGPEF